MLDDTEVARASGTNSASAQPAQTARPTTNTLAVPADDQAAVRSKILGHILERTQPAPLPAAWTFLSPSSKVRTFLCSRSELVASLMAGFSNEELLAAKILVADAENELQLSLVLCEHMFQVVIDADHRPIDLASDVGALFSADPPCFKYACQWHDGTGRRKRVLVAALKDLQILECLGLRCAPAAGLASLDGQQVRRLYANFSLSSLPRYRLTLIGASIADLEGKLHSFIEPILKRLHNVEELSGYGELGNPFEFWPPSATTFDKIRAALTFSDRRMVRRVIRDSTDVYVVSGGDAWAQLHAPDENDLASAHAALECAIAAPRSYCFGSNLSTAAAKLSVAIGHATTRRFLQAAAAASTPQESFALLESAEIIHHLNQNYGPLAAAKSRDGSVLHYDSTISEDRLKEIGLCTNLLLKFGRLCPTQK